MCGLKSDRKTDRGRESSAFWSVILYKSFQIREHCVPWDYNRWALQDPRDTYRFALTYLTLHDIPNLTNPQKTTACTLSPSSRTTKKPRIPLEKVVIFVVLQLSLKEERGGEKSQRRGEMGRRALAESGQTKRNVLIPPVLTSKTAGNSAQLALHSTAPDWGLCVFGLGRSGCNYSFSAVVFPPDLETLWGQEWSST